MASPAFTAFLHAAYLNSNKDWNKTAETLETVIAGNFSTAQNGGRVLISSTLNGKSFSYMLPPGINAQTVSDLAHRCWVFVTNSLKSDATGNSLNCFLTSPRQSATTVADFSHLRS